MAKVRIAIVGLGMAVAPHARSLLDLGERVEVVRAYSRSAARRERFAGEFPFPLTDGLEAIERDPAIDAVLILTPPNTHLEVATRFARAGKHILLEKPLEVSTARAEQLVALCREAGVRLGVVLQHRFRLGSLKLAALLADGSLGRIASASAHMPLWRPQSYYDEPGRGTRERDGGGVLLTQGIHTLDLLLSLAGPAKEVTAFATTSPLHRMETEDLVCGALRFEDGAIGVIDATTACYPGLLERISIIAERGTAVLTGAALEVFLQDGTRLEAGSEEAVAGGADPMAFPHSFHRRLIEDFVGAIEDGRDPHISGEEALKVHRLIDALLASSESRRVVALEG
jgi:UDP-N-acetyl-2-amino-2-deoxyglucuronate dehydrogenase